MTKAVQFGAHKQELLLFSFYFFLKVFSLFNTFIMTNPKKENDLIMSLLFTENPSLACLSQPVEIMSFLLILDSNCLHQLNLLVVSHMTFD